MKKIFEKPIFFPDATRGVVKSIDSDDIRSTGIEGVLVNTYHLYKELGEVNIKKFMNWDGPMISDSGGFQVMSIAKRGRGKIDDNGVTFFDEHKNKITLTPELSINYQMKLGTDMVVVLDDFTPIKARYDDARDTVERTIAWAKRSKDEYGRMCTMLQLDEKTRPAILGVVQGGDYLDLREECANRLAEIGFDGFGYGGWPLHEDKTFNYDVAKVIADNTPEGYFLYGLGVGKPEDIIGCVELGYTVFDCVIPTRDARHKRLFIYNADSIDEIDVRKPNFYSHLNAGKSENLKSDKPVSSACDCHLCENYSRAYLAHLFRIKDTLAFRLATIHNLRFYSLLMEQLAKK